MPTQDEETSPQARTPSAATVKDRPDLSSEIVATIEKEAGDVVRCTRVGLDNYRCNWWVPYAAAGYDNPGMPARLFTTHRVRKSQFLEVTKAPQGLVIRVRPDVGVSSRMAVADA